MRRFSSNPLALAAFLAIAFASTMALPIIVRGSATALPSEPRRCCTERYRLDYPISQLSLYSVPASVRPSDEYEADRISRILVDTAPLLPLTDAEKSQIAQNEKAVVTRLARLQRGEMLFGADESPVVVETAYGPEFVSDGYHFLAFDVGSPAGTPCQFDLRQPLPAQSRYFVFVVPDRRTTGSQAFVTDRSGVVAANSAPGRVGSGTVSCSCGCASFARACGSVATMIGRIDTLHGGGKWQQVAAGSTALPTE